MAKTSFFFHSDAGSVLPLVLRLRAEGHPVTLYIREEAARDIGRGLVPKTTTPTPSPRSVVVFDGVGHGAIGKVLRKQGHPVIGGNLLDQELETDRVEGARIMQHVEIRVPEYHGFRSFPAAIKFLEGHDGEWFVKVGGDQIESATFDTDAKTMIRYLQWCDRKGGKVEPFELQRRAKGTELSLNGWFDGERFVRPFDVTIEEKKFLTGNLGPRTGCESNLVWFMKSDVLADQTLLLLEDRLAQEEYVGALDLNMLIDDTGTPTGLEWTARFGFDALYAWMCLLAPPIGEQLEALAVGSLPQWSVTAEDDYALTLRVSIPPYPTWDTRLLQKTKNLPLDASLLSNESIQPVDVMQTSDGLQAAGGSAVICTVSSVGTDLKVLRRDVLKQAEALEIPNKQYRLDPVSRAERDLKALESVL